MPVTRDQANMLASLAVACRPTGAPRWDAPGVSAAIAKVRHLNLADVVMAVVRAAADRTLNTPACIGIPASSCWQERVAERTAPAREVFDPGTFCGICGNPETRCVRNPHADHEFTRAADMRTHNGAPRPAALRPTPPTRTQQEHHDG